MDEHRRFGGHDKVPLGAELRCCDGVDRREPRGFTLIELLVVIAIIAVLMGIIIPAIRSAKETAKRIVCGSNQKQIGQGIFLYSADADGKLMPPISKDYLHWSHLVFRIDKSKPWGQHITNTYGYGYLHTAKIIENPEVFYCPSASRVVSDSGQLLITFRYEDFHNPGTHPWPWNSDPSEISTHNVRSSFDYTPQAADKQVTLQGEEFPQVATKVTQLHPAYVLGLDALHTLEHVPHKRGFRPNGVNVLFSDGHVDFRNNVEAFDPELWQEQLNDDYRFRIVLRRLAE